MNFVSKPTRVPKAAVGMIEAIVASRVRKTERAGWPRGCPDMSRVPAGTVTVVNVPSDQRPRGVTVRIFPVLSQDRSTAFAGSTLMAPATDAAFIGVVKARVTGSESPRSVEEVVVNAVWASGRIGEVRVATVVCG